MAGRRSAGSPAGVRDASQAHWRSLLTEVGARLRELTPRDPHGDDIPLTLFAVTGPNPAPSLFAGDPFLSSAVGVPVGPAQVWASPALTYPDDPIARLWGWDAPSGEDRTWNAAASQRGVILVVPSWARVPGERERHDAVSIIGVNALGYAASWTDSPLARAHFTSDVSGRIVALLRCCLGAPLDVPGTPRDRSVSVREFAASWVAQRTGHDLFQVHVALPTQGAALAPTVAARHTLQYAANLTWAISDHGAHGLDRAQASLVHHVADGSDPVMVLDSTARRALAGAIATSISDLTWPQVTTRPSMAELLAPLLPPAVLRDPEWGGDELIGILLSRYVGDAGDFLEPLPARTSSAVQEALHELSLA